MRRIRPIPCQFGLRHVVMTLGAAVLVATLLPRGAIAEYADNVCRQNTAAAPTPAPSPYIGISQGRMVIGSPIHRLERFTACQLARWSEPENDLTSMLAFVYNKSANEVFRNAQLLIETEGAPAPANSLPIPIKPSATGVFLFVGPITSIELHGLYRGRVVQFLRRGPPVPCTEFSLYHALQAIERFRPGSTVGTTLRDLDPRGTLHIVYIQVDDSILGQHSTAGQTDTDSVTAYLSDNRDAAAYVLCL